MNRHRIKTTPRTGPDGGVRITLTLDLDKAILRMLSRGGSDDLAYVLEPYTNGLREAVAKAATKPQEAD